MQATFTTQSVRPVTDLIRQARQGVLRRRVDEVANSVGLTDNEMARVLNMSVRSLHGKSDNQALTLAAGERLLLLEGLLKRALSIFDGRTDLVNRWLHTPLDELAYSEETPKHTPALSTRRFGSFEPPTDRTHRVTKPATSNDSRLAGGIAQSPLAVLDTVSGFSLADDVLGRIEWGIIG